MEATCRVFCAVEPLWNQEQAKPDLPRKREYRNLGVAMAALWRPRRGAWPL